MSKPVTTSTIQFLGPPPDKYDKEYTQQLVAIINSLLASLGRGVDLNASSLKMLNLSTTTTGLRQGVVYLKTLTSGEKVLTVVLPGDTF